MAAPQLAEQAKGDYLLFTMQTPYTNRIVSNLLSLPRGRKREDSTGFPRPAGLMGRPGPCPIFLLAMICFIPLGIAYCLRRSALGHSAVGQMDAFPS